MADRNIAFPRVIDNTMVTGYRKCAQYHAWRDHTRIVSEHSNVHLHAGGAFARGLETVRRAYFEGGLPMPDALYHGVIDMILAYGDYVPPAQSTNKSIARLIGALAYYFEAWPIGDTITPATINGRQGIEFDFSVPIPGVEHPDGGPILYSGRFDMFGLHSTGTLMGLDDKTASQLGEQWMNKWRLGGQVTGYWWASHQCGIPIQGFLVRGVSLLAYSYGKAEAMCNRQPWQVEQWLHNLRLTLTDMKRDWARGDWERNFDQACAQYGGCDYLTLCESPVGTVDDWKAIGFVPNTWTPLKGVEA